MHDCPRASFHVGGSPTRLQKIMDRRYLHVLKHKTPSKHMLVVCQNVKGNEHMPLDSHALTKSLTYKCQSTKILQTNFRRRRRLVGGPGLELEDGRSQLADLNPIPPYFSLHLGGFVLIHTRIWWGRGPDGNSP